MKTLTALVAMSLVALPALADDWPGWRGEGQAAQTPALPGDLDGLTLAWKRPVGGKADAGIAVADGIVITPDHDGQRDAYLAFNAKTGEALWARRFAIGREMDFGAGPRTSPLVCGGRVYLLDAFGVLRCIDLKTGKDVWQKDLAKAYDAKVPEWGYCPSPLVSGGRIITNPGGKATLVALDPTTGDEEWASDGTGISYASFIAATLGGVEQLVGVDGDSLGGWDAKTGKRLWRVPVDMSDGYVVPTPVVVGDKLLFASGSFDAALFTFTDNGKIDASKTVRTDELRPDVTTPTVAGNLIVGETGDMVGLDPADKLKAVWFEADAEAVYSAFHTIAAGSRILTFNSDGMVGLFDVGAKGAKLLGEKQITGETLMPPAIADGMLFVRDRGFVYAFELGLAEPAKAE